jgi:hypothetical protein
MDKGPTYKFSAESNCFEDLEIFHKAFENQCKIDRIDNYLRSQIKHGNLSDEVENALQKARDHLYS